MVKGTPVVIAGSAYPKQKYTKKRSTGSQYTSGTTTRKRRMSVQGGRPGAKRIANSGTLFGTGDYSYKGWTPGADAGRPAGRWAANKFKEYANTFIPGSGALIDSIGDIGNYGAKVGAAGGHFLGTLFGQGDYFGNESSISCNSVVNPRQGPPMIVSGITSKTGVRFRRREYLKDIVSSATANTYVNEVFSINPGQPETFPWLSTVAQNFEQYRICGMVFEFVSLSADATASVATSLGYVALATQYDVLDAPFVNKQQLENYDMAQSCKPSRNQIHGLECAKSASTLTELYVRPGEAVAGSDLRMYDFGNFNIANAAPGVSVTLGELWVSYDIELFKPKIPNQIGGIQTSLHANRTSTTGTVLNFGTIQLNTYGTLTYTTSGSGATLNLFNLVIGNQYKVSVQWACTTAISAGPTVASVTGGTLLNYFPNSSTPSAVGQFTTGSAVNNQALVTAFVATSQSVSVSLNNGVIVSGTYNASVWVDGFDNTIVA